MKARYGEQDTNGFVRVLATSAEVEDYKAKHKGFRPAVWRAQCVGCGKRIWKSGLGVGSHRKVCSGYPKK